MWLQRMFLRPWWWCWLPILLLLEGAFIVLLFYSEHGGAFAYESELATRPIFAVVGILAFAAAVYLVGVWGLRHGRPPVWFVILGAVVLRAPLFFSEPIQEDDYYRYLWDGKVSAAGVDPYKFSPEEILLFDPETSGVASGDLSRVAAVRDASSTNQVILDRVNNPSFRTIYPFVAQVTFLFVGCVVPDEASIEGNLLALRLVLAMFDIGTLLLLIRLLRLVGQSAGAAVVYGWCPVVIKEITNSAHIDVVPCFFVVLALVAAVGRRPIVCGVTLALAILSKYYAIVVLPFALLLLARSSGDLVKSTFRAVPIRRLVGCGLTVIAVLAASRLVLTETAQSRQDVLKSFLLQWEMNDALFMWIYKVAEIFSGADTRLPAGEVARWIVGGIFALVVTGFLLRSYFRVQGPASGERTQWAGEILGSIFAVLAALFILSPVGFPWYFVWCVPLLPFARRKSWYLLTGLVSLYYLRFWFAYGTEEEPRALFGYTSESADLFFHHWVVSLEFGVFFLAWIAESLFRSGARSTT